MMNFDDAWGQSVYIYVEEYLAVRERWMIYAYRPGPLETECYDTSKADESTVIAAALFYGIIMYVG
jgi:hypothetical protein